MTSFKHPSYTLHESSNGGWRHRLALECGTAALTVLLMALLASALPATRAASADPIDALRSI